MPLFIVANDIACPRKLNELSIDLLIRGIQEGAGERPLSVPDGSIVPGSCGTRPPLWLLVRYRELAEFCT